MRNRKRRHGEGAIPECQNERAPLAFNRAKPADHHRSEYNAQHHCDIHGGKLIRAAVKHIADDDRQHNLTGAKIENPDAQNDKGWCQ